MYSIITTATRVGQPVQEGGTYKLPSEKSLKKIKKEIISLKISVKNNGLQVFLTKQTSRKLQFRKQGQII